MKDLEKKINKAAKEYQSNLISNLIEHKHPLRQGHIYDTWVRSAKSPEAKEYWQQGMYGEENMKNSFLAGRNYQRAENYEDRTGEDHNTPDFDKWFEQNKKKS